MSSSHRPIDQRIARAIIAEATERAVRDGPHGCLIWPDAFGHGGYGVTNWGGHRAHRLAYTAAYHDPGPLMVRHVVCGNPPCFDYLHLAEGTAADNNADTVRMGRHAGTLRKVLDDERAKFAADLINRGMTIVDAAEFVGVGASTLTRYVQPYLDASVTSGRHARKVTDADVLAARRDYSSGAATLRQISDRLRISWPAAQKMVKGETYKHVGFAHVGGPVVIERAAAVCSVPGCGRDVLARGWCTAHYNRWQIHGDVQADKPLRVHSRAPGHNPAPAKLTEDDVRSIRRRHANGEKVAHIARDLGVAHGTIKAVVDRRTWAHVPDKGVGS